MNRPKITKQTLKELRGELLSKQNAQKQEVKSKPPDITQTTGVVNENEEQKEQELEDGMDM